MRKNEFKRRLTLLINFSHAMTERFEQLEKDNLQLKKELAELTKEAGYEAYNKNE